MPVKNYFPAFHKLKSGAYSYVWTDKCEKLLPKYYKDQCLKYMLTEPKPVHWIPDTRKYRLDDHGVRQTVQNHPIHVKFPIQCNYGLWAGEGIVQCYLRKVKSKKYNDLMTPRVAKFYAPLISERLLFSEILNKWYKIPCTNRAMDQIDDMFGLDYYILRTSERDLNSKLGMDLKRLMLLRLCQDAKVDKLSKKRQAIFNRYGKFMILEEKAEWVGLSITEALEKAELERNQKQPRPLKDLITKKYLIELKEYNEENKHQSEQTIDEDDKNAQMIAESRQPEKEKPAFVRFVSMIPGMKKKTDENQK